MKTRIVGYKSGNGWEYHIQQKMFGWIWTDLSIYEICPKIHKNKTYYGFLGTTTKFKTKSLKKAQEALRWYESDFNNLLGYDVETNEIKFLSYAFIEDCIFYYNGYTDFTEATCARKFIKEI